MAQETVGQELDLNEIKRRVQHAAYQDGLLEMFLGSFLMVFAVLFLSKPALSAFSVLVTLAFKPLFERMKQRYIYPRIGYVKFGKDKEGDPKGIVIAAIVFVIVLLGTLGILALAMGAERGRVFWLDYVLPGFTGFMMAIGPYWLGQTYGLVRAYVFAALFLLGGIAIPALGIATGYHAVGLLCLLMGLLSLVSGAIMFGRFLRRYPVEEVLDASD
jgi:hypothetical protein